MMKNTPHKKTALKTNNEHKRNNSSDRYANYQKSHLAKNIKTLRERKGETQVSMAKVLGVARQTYLDLETGKTDARSTMLTKLAMAFDVTVERLLMEEECSEYALGYEHGLKSAIKAITEKHTTINFS